MKKSRILVILILLISLLQTQVYATSDSSGNIRGGKDITRNKIVTSTIKSIDDISVVVSINERYKLPVKVTAIMDNETTKSVKVKWAPSKAVTSVVGTYNYKGIVDGYSNGVKLTLKVIDPNSFEIVDPIISGYVYHFKGINIDFNRDIQVPNDWSQIKITDSNGIEMSIDDVRTTISTKELQVYSKSLETGNSYTIRIPANAISDLDGNKYDRDIEILFKIEYQIIFIEDITKTVSQNESYSLPSTVIGTFYDGTEEIKGESYKVVWDKSVVDTNVIGTYTFYGTVNGYSSDVKLTLNVVALPSFEIVSPIADGNVYHFKGINFVFNRNIQVPTDWSQIKITDSNGVEIPIDIVRTTIYPYELQVYSSSIGYGDYTIRILANTISDIYGNKYDRDIEIGFRVEYGIASIQDITVAVNQNESYSLPSTVTGYMTDGSRESFSVVWDSVAVDTSIIGTHTYFGTVDGYPINIKLTLNVVAVK